MSRRKWMPVVLCATVGLVLLNVRPARACDPQAMYAVVIEVDDTPDCLDVSTMFSDNEGKLQLDNLCAEPIRVSGTKCAACDAAMEVKPGESAEFVIESRKIGKGLVADVPTKQSLTWTMGAVSGAVATKVTWHDTWAACRKKDPSGKPRKKPRDEGLFGGCSVSAPGRAEGARVAVFAAFLGLFVLARGRRREMSARPSAPPCRRSPSFR